MKRLFGIVFVAVLVVITSAYVVYACCDPGSYDCSACTDAGGLCDQALCTCQFKSPIIIDVSGNGFSLTSIANGVQFQFGATDPLTQTAWTSPGSDDVFLFLDRNNNGVVDNATELFGNDTPQPLVSNPNGFNALAVYDMPQNGGNGDGQIDSRDAIFSSLRLWRDSNHDGVSQPDELFTLPALGIYTISLRYHQSLRKDQFHNVFRYCAAVNGDASHEACDVFFAQINPRKGVISK